MATGAGNFTRCTACKAAGKQADCRRYRYDAVGKELCSALVATSIRSGELKNPRGMACADCGGVAGEYEHRDYNQPLSVVPICRRCNLLRGPAKPLAGWLERAVQYGCTPYRLRRNAMRVFGMLGWPTDALEAMPTKLTHAHYVKLSASLADQPTKG